MCSAQPTNLRGGVINNCPTLGSEPVKQGEECLAELPRWMPNYLIVIIYAKSFLGGKLVDHDVA